MLCQDRNALSPCIIAASHVKLETPDKNLSFKLIRILNHSIDIHLIALTSFRLIATLSLVLQTRDHNTGKMPRTTLHNDPGISIELDSPQIYGVVPGDILTGFVVLQPLWNARRFSRVQLRLYGRTKTKISRSNGQTTSIYRGRRLLFEIQRILHSEKDGCSSGEHAWPFAVDIPKSPSKGEKYGDVYKPKPGFLSMKEEMGKHGLPTIYYYYVGMGMGFTKAEAYVEYIFKVEVSSPSTSQTQTATLPLALRAPSTEKPIMEFKIKSRSVPITIKALRLLPEHATEHPGARKQVKSFFRPSKVPQYAFTLKVDYPTVVQLDHPDPLPMRISIIPDLNPSKTTMDLTNGLPDVRVVGMSVCLRSTTTVQAPTTFSSTESDKTHEYHFDFKMPFHPSQYTIPVDKLSDLKAGVKTGDPSVTEAARLEKILHFYPAYVLNPVASTSPLETTPVPAFLDLTPLLSLRLTRTHSSAQGLKSSRFDHPLTATFSTYNIAVKYEIRWKIEIECAGQMDDISNSFGFAWDECSVLDRSEEQVKAQGSEWVGKERGRDWDEVGNVVGVAGQGLQAIFGLLG